MVYGFRLWMSSREAFLHITATACHHSINGQVLAVEWTAKVARSVLAVMDVLATEDSIQGIFRHPTPIWRLGRCIKHWNPSN